MDTYYRDLMAKERAAFERILVSKVSTQGIQIERKFHKQRKEAQARLEKAEALEGRFNESQNHAKRLMKEVEQLKRQKAAVEKTNKSLKNENNGLKKKLDHLWARQEETLEHARLYSRYETNKLNQEEIQRLVDRIRELEDNMRAS